MSSREMLAVLRGLAGVNIVAADVVGVAPAYDPAELTSLAAAPIAYELITRFACRPAQS
jgi:agmatinase